MLNVWHEQRPVGQLWRTATGAIGLRYDPEWIHGGGFAVSRSLPLSRRRHVYANVPADARPRLSLAGAHGEGGDHDGTIPYRVR